MRKKLFLISLFSVTIKVMAQIPIIVPGIPYENHYTINNFPKSNDQISFTLPRPFIDYADSIPDKNTTYQYLAGLLPVNDSLLSECVKFTMLSLNYEHRYVDAKKGTEIWYGVSKGNIPTLAGIYYKKFPDSTRLYVLTAFSLTYFDKKNKTNLSKSICDRVKFILEKRLNQAAPEVPLLSRVSIDDQAYAEYTYTRANLVSEEKTRYQYIRHHYNDHNQLISSDYYIDLSLVSSSSVVLDSARKRKEWICPGNAPKSFSRTFEYNGKGQLVKSTEMVGYATYNYDKNNLISRQTYYHENRETGYTEYTYDRNGNLVKTCHFEVSPSGAAQLATTHACEFDKKPNPYRSFRALMIPGKNTNPNNITKETYTLHLMPNEQHTDEFRYIYNEQGYPVKMNGNTGYFYR